MYSTVSDLSLINDAAFGGASRNNGLDKIFAKKEDTMGRTLTKDVRVLSRSIYT